MKVYICWDRGLEVLVPIKVLECEKSDVDEKVKDFLKRYCATIHYEDIVIDRTLSTSNGNVCVTVKTIDQRFL